MWDDYHELNKSEVADVKNVGGRWGGAITAAKFLENFVDKKISVGSSGYCGSINAE